MFYPILNESIIKRAIDNNIVKINIYDLRDYTPYNHKQVDDTPYGGGNGMVIMVEPLYNAIKALKKDNSRIILTSPQGKTYKQEDSYRLKKYNHLIIIAGQYEGYDERIRNYIDEEISIGDYVLTGGELPAMIIVDSVVRLLDNAIKKESYLNDSFSNWLLEHPHYTKPRTFNGLEVPEVLLNGNHELIRKYRLKESLRRTYLRRKDLLENKVLTKEEKLLLEEITNEKNK